MYIIELTSMILVAGFCDCYEPAEIYTEREKGSTRELQK
jgi:hypothetical protein